MRTSQPRFVSRGIEQRVSRREDREPVDPVGARGNPVRESGKVVDEHLDLARTGPTHEDPLDAVAHRLVDQDVGFVRRDRNAQDHSLMAEEKMRLPTADGPDLDGTVVAPGHHDRLRRVQREPEIDGAV